MRILVLASTFPRWKGDTTPPFVYHLSSGLAAKGHAIHVLAPHAYGAAVEERMGDLYVHRFRYAAEKLESLCYAGGILDNLRQRPIRWGLVPVFLASQFFAIRRLLKKYPIDLIHAHWFLPQGLTAGMSTLCARCPLVITGHGGDVWATQSDIRQRILRFTVRRADVCTVVSTPAAAELQRLTGITATVIPMGVNPSLFVPQMHETPASVSDAQSSVLRALFVGRLVEKKGVTYLLQAIPDLIQVFPNMRLVIVGEGPERIALEALTHQLGLTGHVQFVGAVPNEMLHTYYGRADMFVAPSIVDQACNAEGLPVVLLEAASAGVPIVASRVGGITDVIRHEETGLLVNPGCPQELANAIIRVWRDSALRLRITANARHLVENNFSWESVVNRFDTLFRGLLHNRAR